MSKNNIIELEGLEASTDPLTELLQAGAQKLILQAVDAELCVQLKQYTDRRTEGGHAGEWFAMAISLSERFKLASGR